MSEPEIICERTGRAGVVTLNRPRALNAITHGMVAELADALDRWETDPDVTRVVVKAAGDRAFSAGGDIRALYEAGKAERYAEALAFWSDEYRLNIRIKRYPKPYLSLIDGIVMGGGVGLSLHGSHRVAGDRYRFAMPEVGIGFFPDVGATYALPRLPGEAGLYLALTGERLGPGDACRLGLATHFVPSKRIAGLFDALVRGDDLDQTLSGAAREPEDVPVFRERAVIDSCFAGDSLDEVLERLDDHRSAFAAATATTIRTKSPASLAITFEQMRRGRHLSFEDAMATEFRIVSRIVRGRDFYEGVRAAIIDKGASPAWEHGSIADVNPAWLVEHFADLGPDELAVR